MTPLIGISATNPCHLYDMARALHARAALGTYHSGYPRWRLRPPPGMKLRTHTWRTVTTYAWRRLPTRLRPADHRLFRWQDDGFDRAVARDLQPEDGGFVHALPGQARETFRAARQLGQRTVLNHASGPTRLQLALVAEEYRRAGVNHSAHHGFDAAYRAREDAEYCLADYHCVASTIVRDQLVSLGIDRNRIWIVPYGADPNVFYRPAPNVARPPTRIVFAGQLTQRKGLRVLFAAADLLRRTLPIHVDLYGPIASDVESDLTPRRAEPWVTCHGAVSQAELALAFQSGTVLVLPSWEEAFGLVVPQALNCGLPCVVTDRVGAGDLIQPRRNGSIVPAGDAPRLAAEIAWWLQNRESFTSPIFTWDAPAEQLIATTGAAAADK